METGSIPTAVEEEQDDFEDAVAEFRSSVAAVLGSPETERRIIELYDAYSSVLYEAMQSPRVANRAAERYEIYARAVTEAFSDAAALDELERAFSAYVDALQQGWSALDTASLEPHDLASIAEEMQWVAGVMGVVQSTAGSEE
jgi:hypothetical protein